MARTRYVKNPKLPLKKSDLKEPPDYIPGYPLNAEDRRRYNKVLQSRSNYVPAPKAPKVPKKKKVTRYARQNASLNNPITKSSFTSKPNANETPEQRYLRYKAKRK